MPIKFPCPRCKLPLRIDRRFAGRSGKCPSCAFKLTVPEIEVVGPPDALKYQTDNNSPNRQSSVPEQGRTNSIKSPAPSTQTSNEHSIESSRSTDKHSDNDDADENHPADKRLAGNHSTSSRLAEAQVATKFPATSPVRNMPATESSSAFDHVLSANANSVQIPRWIILTQGALLGTVALTFFLFGMMVGTLTSPKQTAAVDLSKTELSGSVFTLGDGQRIADMGTVVIVLPFDIGPEFRPDPDLLRPQSYKPLDNEAKAIIEESGGQVIRVNSDGNYSALVDSNRKYQVLVISKNSRAKSGDVISKQMRAELGAFFLPLEELLKNQAFHWEEILLTTKPKKLDVVIFE